MKVLTWVVLALMATAMLVAIHQSVAILMTSHGWKGLGPADWAAWVQAVGSIAAIWGAVWIANGARASAEAATRQQAILLVAQYWSVLQMFHQYLGDVDISLRTITESYPRLIDWMSMRDGIDNRPRFAAPEHTLMLALGGECALNLALADADLEYAKAQINLIIEVLSSGTGQERLSANIHLTIGGIKRSVKRLKLALDVIATVVDPGAGI